MYWLIGVMTLSLFVMIAAGLYFEMRPPVRTANPRGWLKGTIATNLLVFVAAQVGLVLLGIQEVMAQEVAVEGAREISVGMGLAMIGIGIPTAMATIGAGIAVGPVGAASLAVVAEKPEIFGRTLVYLGLAEGIAIYGLVMSILMLDKI